MTCALFRRTLAAGCKQGVRDMRLRLFERVRRLAHPRAGRLRPRRDRAGETARHDRPWEARAPVRPGDMHGQAASASTEAAGRHRRNSQEITGPPAHEAATRGGPPWAGQPGPPWDDTPRGGPPGIGRPAGPDTGATYGVTLGPPAPGAGDTAGRPQGDAPGLPVGGARARVRRDSYGTAPVVPPPAARQGGRQGGPAVQPGGGSETAMVRGPARLRSRRAASGRRPAHGGRGRCRPAPAALRARA